MEGPSTRWHPLLTLISVASTGMDSSGEGDQQGPQLTFWELCLLLSVVWAHRGWGGSRGVHGLHSRWVSGMAQLLARCPKPFSQGLEELPGGAPTHYFSSAWAQAQVWESAQLRHVLVSGPGTSPSQLYHRQR